MKHLYTSLALSFLASSAGAQITIANGDMPVPNDTVRYSYALGIDTADQHNTGANYTWDYRFLSPTAQQFTQFYTPTAVPLNFLSTVAVYNMSPDSLPGIGSIPSDFYDYYKNGSSGYRQVGSSFMFQLSFAIPIIYNNADYVYRFPMNYMNVDSSSSDYGFTIPGIGYLGMDRKRVNNVDGWGTLQTPFGSFQTLRVRSVVDETDTISLDTTNQTGFTLPRPTVIQYKWLANGMKTPVLEIDAQLINNTEIISNVVYQDSLRDSVFQINSVPEQWIASQVDVFPNPSSSTTYVRYELKQAAAVSFGLYDISGRLVEQLDAGKKAGGFQLQSIDVSGLEPGLYLLRIRAGETVVTKRLCRQ